MILSGDTAGPRTLAMVLAGGEGKRLHPLTADRAKPAVPFGGHYRLIDFALSNLVNGGFRQIVVLTQYKSHSLGVHLSLTWRLSPLLGNFVTAVPAQMRQGPRWFLGSADAIFQNLNLISDHAPDYVLVFGADHIYRMDPRPMLEQHIASGAGVTVAAIRMPRDQSGEFGVIEMGAGTRIGAFHEKPESPVGLADAPERSLVSMGNYVFSTDVLLDLLHADATAEDSSHDVGRDLLPPLVASGDAHAYDFSGNVIPGEAMNGPRYWRDVGTLDAYFDAHMDLVSPLPAFDLYNEEWPVHTWFPAAPPAKVVQDPAAGPSSVNDSLLCAGVIVSGASVYQSVLSPGVVVQPGARVDGAVLLDGVVIGRGAQVRRAILDKNVVVPSDVRVGYDHDEDVARGLTVSPGGIVVAPKNFRFLTA
jgi:glucose-1-phosphate adenylyltransferase